MLPRKVTAFIAICCVVLTSLSACDFPWSTHPTPPTATGSVWGFPYQPGTTVTLGCLGLHDDNFRADGKYTFNNAHPQGLPGAPAFKCPPDVLSSSVDPTKANEASLDLIASSIGVPVIPLAVGTVLVADESCHLVVVDHGSHTWVAYLHLDIAAHVGDHVTTSTILGHTAPPPVKSPCGEVTNAPHVHIAFMTGSGLTGSYVSMVGKVLCGYQVVKNATYPYGALQEVAAPHTVIAPNDSFTVPQSCSSGVGANISTPTPTLDQLSVYVGNFSDGTLSARNAATGKVRWTYPSGSTVEGFITPVAYDSGTVFATVYLGDSWPLYAINAASGQSMWHIDLPAHSSGFLGIMDGLVYVQDMTGSGNSVLGLDPSTGHVMFYYRLGSDVVIDFVQSGGINYIAHGADTSGIIQLDAVPVAAGVRKWNITIGTCGQQTPSSCSGRGYMGGNLSVSNGVVYAETCDITDGLCTNTSHVLAYDSATGHPKWQHTILSPFISMRVAGSQIFVRTTTDPSGNTLYDAYQVLDARTGSPLWASPANCGYASILGAADVAYVTCGGEAAAVDPATGNALWEASPATSGSFTALEIAGMNGDVVYVQVDTPTSVNSETYGYFALDAASGFDLWFNTGSYIVTGPGLTILGIGYIAPGDGPGADNLTVVRNNDGAQLWATHDTDAITDEATSVVIG